MRTFLRRLLERRAQPLPARWRNIVIIVAATGLIAATVWAWRSSGLSTNDIRWTPVVLFFLIAGPASIAMKAAGYVVSARIVDQRPGVSESVQIAVVSSAANLLPVPGSLVVTVRSLAGKGSTYGAAIAAGAVPGLSWIAFAATFGGLAIGVEGSLWVGLPVVTIGVAAGVGATVLFRRVAPRQGRGILFAQLVAAQAGWLLVSALRLGLAMSALGIDYEPTQAIALSVAGAAATAIGFLPGGLGVREGLIAVLAPVVGLPIDAGVLVGSLDRVIWLAFLAVAAGLVVRTRKPT